MSDPGFATAAAFGWCVDAHAELDADDARRPCSTCTATTTPPRQTGRAVVGLGQTYRMVAPQLPNMSALALPFLLPQWPMGKAVTDGLTAADLDAVRAPRRRHRRSRSGRARPGRPDGALVIEEIAATARPAPPRLSTTPRLRLGGRRHPGVGAEPADRDALATELGTRIEEYRRLWLERFRPGGLSDSTAWFEHLLDCYRTGHDRSVAGSAPSADRWRRTVSAEGCEGPPVGWADRHRSRSHTVDGPRHQPHTTPRGRPGPQRRPGRRPSWSAAWWPTPRACSPTPGTTSPTWPGWPCRCSPSGGPLRPRSPSHSFGYHRGPILAALGNAAVIAVVTVAIVVESVDPPPPSPAGPRGPGRDRRRRAPS